MDIQGTIVQADPPDYTDDYGNVHQNIVIADQSGAHHNGRIASKKGYTPQTPVNVTVEQTDKGLRFRRFDPQYAQQGQPQATQGYQQPRHQQQAQQTYHPVQQPQGPDKDTMIVRQSSMRTASIRLGSASSPMDIIEEAEIYNAYVFGGINAAKKKFQIDSAMPQGPLAGDNDIPFS